MHALLRFLSESPDYGTPDGYSTEQTESEHKPLKKIYVTTNKKEFAAQVSNGVENVIVGNVPREVQLSCALPPRWLKDSFTGNLSRHIALRLDGIWGNPSTSSRRSFFPKLVATPSDKPLSDPRAGLHS